MPSNTNPRASFSKKSSEFWREALKFIGRCPVCDKNYKAETARLFAKKESVNMVHIACGSCGSALIAMITAMGQGMSSVGMVTDLTFEDAQKLYSRDPITLDQALDASEELRRRY